MIDSSHILISILVTSGVFGVIILFIMFARLARKGSKGVIMVLSLLGMGLVPDPNVENQQKIMLEEKRIKKSENGAGDPPDPAG